MKQITVIFTCWLFLGASSIATVARAEPITTSMLLERQRSTVARDKVNNFIQRPDVIQVFERLGVPTQEATTRVAMLSDDEVESLSQQIDQAPVGGDAVGEVVGALLLVFFVLLVTDILGMTKVFPFTRSVAH